MAIVLENTTEYSVTAVGSDSLSFNHVCSGAGNRLLTVLIGRSANSYTEAPTVITYGGNALSNFSSFVNTGQLQSYWAYQLANPPSGTNALVISFAQVMRGAVAVYTWSGVDQSNPVGNSVNSNTYTLSISTNSNALVIDAIQFTPAGSASASVKTGQTLISNFTGAGTGGSSVRLATSYKTDSALGVMGWQQSGAAIVTHHGFTINGVPLFSISSVSGDNNVQSGEVDAEVVGQGLSAGLTVTYKGIACTVLSASGSTSIKVTFPDFISNNIKLGATHEFKVNT